MARSATAAARRELPRPRPPADLRRTSRRECIACGVGVWGLGFELEEADEFRCTVCKGGEPLESFPWAS